MFNILIQGIFRLIKLITNIILLPINLIVINALPDFSSVINNFNNLVSVYVGSGLGWFSNLLPPVTKSLIVFYLGLLVVLYTTSLTIHLSLKIFKIIKNIKFW